MHPQAAHSCLAGLTIYVAANQHAPFSFAPRAKRFFTQQLRVKV